MEVDENNAASNKEIPATTSGETPMEIDEDTSERNPAMSATPASAIKVMASSGTVGSVSISLHPLVIMNISEHWTRLRAQEGSDQLGKISLILLFEFLPIESFMIPLISSLSQLDYHPSYLAKTVVITDNDV